MLCAPFTAQATVRFASPETPMPRRIDHLIICVRDLAQAALSWQTLGFTLTPTGVHPFGTSNRLAMFANSFLELLAVTDAAAIPAAAPRPLQLRCSQPGFSRRGGGDVDAGLAQHRRACRCGALQGK